MPEQLEIPEIPEKKPASKKAEEGRWRNVLDSALTTVIVALVLGFFATIWRASTSIDEKLSDLTKKADDSAQALRATTDVLTAEMAKMQVQNHLQRIEHLEQELAAQHDQIQQLRNFIAQGPATTTRQPPNFKPPAVFKPAPIADVIKSSAEEQMRIVKAIQQKRS